MFNFFFFRQKSGNKKKYLQKFRTEWLKQDIFKDWLCFIENKKDGKKPKCKFCCIILSNKKSDLLKHANSKKHCDNAGTIFAPSKQKVIQFKSKQKIKKIQEKAHEAEATTAMYIAMHSNMNASHHLNIINKKNFNDSATAEHFKMDRTKSTAIINNVLAPHFKNELKNDIGDEFYSIIIDESTDITVLKYLGIVIKYYSKTNKKIVSTFLHLAQLTTCNADALVDAILNTLKEYGLDEQKMIGLGTDNASVLVGVNNGVYVKLKRSIPHLVLMRCVNHSLQLALSHASVNSFPLSIDYIISHTYNWFAHSSVRQAKYDHTYSLLNEGNENHLQFVRKSDTRWISVEPAVDRIVNQWVELKTFFTEVAITEKDHHAATLSEMYNNDEVLAYLLFLRPILRDVQRVNKQFQARYADPTKLLEDLELLLKGLIWKVCQEEDIDLLETEIENRILPIPNINLGYQFEKQLLKMKENGYGIDEETMVRQKCLDFILSLIGQIRQRFPTNYSVLKKINRICVAKALTPNKEKLCDIAEHFSLNDNIIEQIEMQWNNLHLVNWNECNNTVQFWVEVFSYTDATDENPFKDVAMLAIMLLSLPYSNAEVERTFSQLNLVKNKLRNRMLPKTLLSILHIRCFLKTINKCCCNYDLPKQLLQKIGTMNTYIVENNAAAVGVDYVDNDDEMEILQIITM